MIKVRRWEGWAGPGPANRSEARVWGFLLVPTLFGKPHHERSHRKDVRREFVDLKWSLPNTNKADES